MALFAFVQYNDPDGIQWMFVYGVPALLALTAAIRPQAYQSPVIHGFLLICLLLAIVGTFYYWPKSDKWWSQEIWWEVETAREGMGMMITVVVLAIVYWAQYRLRTRR
jgi:hypothetical protein